jgi:hypothetical protein
VAVGDAVVPGQNIAEVGSSGNSTDPHLHFELWYDSLYLVDPFSGPCGNAYNFWIDLLPYDTTFHVWEYGLTDYVPPIDSLRERPKARVKFSGQDSIITFWNLQYGLKRGDSTKIEWITPDGIKWFEYSYTYQKDWWFYYYYSYIFTPPDSELGEWTYHYYYNDSLVLTDHFMFTLPVNVMGQSENTETVLHRIGKRKIAVDLPKGIRADYAEVYTLSGKRVLRKQLNIISYFELDIPGTNPNTEIYLLVVSYHRGRLTLKFNL